MHAAAADFVFVDQLMQNVHQRRNVHAFFLRIAGDKFEQLFRMIEDIFRVVRDGEALFADHVAQADVIPKRCCRVHASLRIHGRMQRADRCAEDAAGLDAQLVQRGNSADFVSAFRTAAAQYERCFGRNERAHQARPSIFAMAVSISAVFSMPISAELMQIS